MTTFKWFVYQYALARTIILQVSVPALPNSVFVIESGSPSKDEVENQSIMCTQKSNPNLSYLLSIPQTGGGKPPPYTPLYQYFVPTWKKHDNKNSGYVRLWWTQSLSGEGCGCSSCLVYDYFICSLGWRGSFLSVSALLSMIFIPNSCTQLTFIFVIRVLYVLMVISAVLYNNLCMRISPLGYLTTLGDHSLTTASEKCSLFSVVSVSGHL